MLEPLSGVVRPSQKPRLAGLVSVTQGRLAFGDDAVLRLGTDVEARPLVSLFFSWVHGKSEHEEESGCQRCQAGPGGDPQCVGRQVVVEG